MGDVLVLLAAFLLVVIVGAVIGALIGWYLVAAFHVLTWGWAGTRALARRVAGRRRSARTALTERLNLARDAAVQTPPVTVEVAEPFGAPWVVSEVRLPPGTVIPAGRVHPGRCPVGPFATADDAERWALDRANEVGVDDFDCSVLLSRLYRPGER